MYVIDVLFSSTVTSSEGLCEMLMILMKKLIEKETGVDVVFKFFLTLHAHAESLPASFCLLFFDIRKP